MNRADLDKLCFAAAVKVNDIVLAQSEQAFIRARKDKAVFCFCRAIAAIRVNLSDRAVKNREVVVIVAVKVDDLFLREILRGFFEKLLVGERIAVSFKLLSDGCAVFVKNKSAQIIEVGQVIVKTDFYVLAIL